MQNCILLLIRFYQYFISPLLGQNCKFHPSCSSYAKQAVIKYGSLKGSYLSFKRIVKCQPFCEGGDDPVT